MNLTNYHELSIRGSDTKAGFQFEFHCNNCSSTWKSPFESYRRGQLAGFIYKCAYFLGDRGSLYRATATVSDIGAAKARDKALQRAIELAEQLYVQCPQCRQAVCASCWDARAGVCESCSERGGGQRKLRSDAAARHDDDGAVAAAACPNCSASTDGGRFCPECGFDMASTHKACPGCSALCTRASRFCKDCGHGF